MTESAQNEIECIITGRVQMVMFRDFAMRRGRRLKLTGAAQNLPDGSVRVVAQGEKVKLIKYIELLKKGPWLAKVREVKVVWREIDTAINDFNIIY